MTTIIYGDSNTYGYNPETGGRYPNGGWVSLMQQKTDARLINLGVPGRCVPSDPSYAIMREIEAVYTDNPSLWIMLGDNDLLEGYAAVNVGKRMKQFISAALDIFTADRILLIAPPVMKSGTWVASRTIIAESEELQNVYEKVADETGVSFISTADWNIPLMFDGVHFTEDGHRIFADQFSIANCRFLVKKNPVRAA